MKKSLIVILLIGSVHHLLCAQDYRKGFIVQMSGDTTFGLVNFREGVKAHKSCEFKANENAQPVSWLPGQIAGYGFMGDRYYESGNFKLPGEETSQAIFIEVLVHGTLSAYKYDKVYFIGKGGEKPQPLMNKTVVTEYNGKMVQKQSNEHIALANMLTYDCPEVKSDVESLRLRERNVTVLAEKYNRCKGGSSVTYKAAKPFATALLGFSAGYSMSNLTLETDFNGFDPFEGEYEPSSTFLIGLSLDVFSPRVSERLSFHTDFLFMSTKYVHDHTIEYSLGTQRNNINLDLQQLRVPIGFRYAFAGKKIAPFINGGIARTFYFSSESKWIRETENNGNIDTDEFDGLTLIRNRYGFWGGAGVSRSISPKLDASLEFRYEQRSGFAQYITDFSANVLQSQFTGYQIIFNIRLK